MTEDPYAYVVEWREPGRDMHAFCKTKEHAVEQYRAVAQLNPSIKPLYAGPALETR